MYDMSTYIKQLVLLIKLQNATCTDYTGQQRFCPMRKKSVSDVFLDAEFKYVSRISLSPTPFAPG